MKINIFKIIVRYQHHLIIYKLPIFRDIIDKSEPSPGKQKREL